MLVGAPDGRRLENFRKHFQPILSQTTFTNCQMLTTRALFKEYGEPLNVV